MCEHLEEEIVAFVWIDEVELSRPGLRRSQHRRLREERREQQVVQLEGAPTARRIVVAVAQQTSRAVVVRDDLVRRICDDDRIRKRIDHQLQSFTLLRQGVTPRMGALESLETPDDRACQNRDVERLGKRGVGDGTFYEDHPDWSYARALLDRLEHPD